MPSDWFPFFQFPTLQEKRRDVLESEKRVLNVFSPFSSPPNITSTTEVVKI